MLLFEVAIRSSYIANTSFFSVIKMSPKEKSFLPLKILLRFLKTEYMLDVLFLTR